MTDRSPGSEVGILPDPVVLWAATYHIGDPLGKQSAGWPLLTLCGLEVPENAGLAERRSYLHICKRCLRAEAKS